MTKALKSDRKKITPYQLFGWTPLLLTVIGSGIVVAFSVLRDL